jgi:hypothetical protein
MIIAWTKANNTDRHDITEILLKVPLITINQTNKAGYGKGHVLISMEQRDTTLDKINIKGYTSHLCKSFI